MSGDVLSLTPTETEIHVWQVNLAVSSNDCQQLAPLLSADERARAERFRFPRDRDRFIVSRGTLRTLLGRYLNTSPDRIQFICFTHLPVMKVPKMCLPLS